MKFFERLREKRTVESDSRALRWGSRIVAVLIGSYFSYVLAAWVFLSFGGLEFATRNEKNARVLTSSGYSLFPGYLHVSDLKVRFQDYNVEMEVSADTADVSLALFELPLRAIHASWVRATGVEFRMLHRVRDPMANAERIVRFPHIEGFDRPKYYDTPPPKPTGEREWRVRVDSIDADARLAWIVEYQLRGRLTVRGAFEVDPAKAATVRPSVVEIHEGRVSTGPNPVLSGVHGRVEATVETFYPPISPLEVVVPRISGVAQLNARVDSLDAAKLYVDAAPLEVSGGGALDMDAQFTHGGIASGSRATLAFERIVARGEDAEVSARVALVLSASSPRHFELDARATAPESGASDAFQGGSARVRASFVHDTVLDARLERMTLGIEALKWGRPDFARVLTKLADATIPLSGALDAEASLEWPAGKPAKLAAKVEGRRLNFRAGNLRFGLTFEAETHCEGSSEEASCSVDAHVPYALFDSEGSRGARSVWLRANAKEISLRLREPKVLGTFLVVGGDPKPIISELVGDDWAGQLGLSVVSTGAIAGRIRLDAGSERVRVLVPALSLGSSRLRGGLDAEKRLRGAFLFQGAPIHFGLEVDDEGVKIRPLASSEWLASFGFVPENG